MELSPGTKEFQLAVKSAKLEQHKKYSGGSRASKKRRKRTDVEDTERYLMQLRTNPDKEELMKELKQFESYNKPP